MKFIQRPWKNDPRSRKFLHSQLFGTVKSFSETLGRPLLPPENQGDSSRCAAYAGALAGAYIHGTRFSPEWQADKISRLQGFSIDTGGSDPNQAMKSQTYDAVGGYLPDGSWGPASTNYFDTIAQNYANSGYVKVDAAPDFFDGIKSALMLAYDPSTKRGAPVQAFGRWYNDWTYAPGGIVPSSYSQLAGYHSYDFLDFTTINEVQYLIAENSWGPDVGNGGYFYFARAIVNAEFSQPNTSLKIVKPLAAAQIALAKQETPFGRIQRLIINVWYALSALYDN